MLVLTRRVGEFIVINGNIRVAVVALSGNRVRLGIEAPTTIGIQREELRDRPKANDHHGQPATAS